MKQFIWLNLVHAPTNWKGKLLFSPSTGIFFSFSDQGTILSSVHCNDEHGLSLAENEKEIIELLNKLTGSFGDGD